MKKIICWTLLVLLSFGNANFVFSQALFSDVPEDYWANNFIEEMQNMGAVNGYPDGTFKPENPVTRAEFCAMAVSAAGIVPASKDNPRQWEYSYIENNHWANNYMKSMFYFTDYYGEWYLKDSVQPDAYVSRAEVAMGLSEIVDVNGLARSTAGFEDDVKNELSKKYSDYDTFGGHTAFIYFASQKGLINGYPDGTFKPSKLVTRAELCTMLYLAYSKDIENNISSEHKDEIKRAGNVMYTVNKDTYYLYRAMNNRLSAINGINRLTEEDLKKRVNGNAGDTLIEDVLSDLMYYSTTNSLSASIILFVQNDINYLNDPDNRDYAKFPYETLYDGGGDCEDKSILMCSLLKNAGYDVCLIVFSDHVGVGVAVNEPIENGYYYTLNNKDYYYLETTCSGWLPGELPEEYINEKALICDLTTSQTMQAAYDNGKYIQQQNQQKYDEEYNALAEWALEKREKIYEEAENIYNSIVGKYDLSGKGYSAGANGGNIDSFAAANAMRQQQALIAKAKETAEAAKNEYIENQLKILSEEFELKLKLLNAKYGIK